MENTTPPPAHTPGPWTVRTPARLDLKTYVHAADDIVCDVYGNADASDITRANARLIAAAPELLERCKMSLADAEAIVALPARADNFNWQSIADDLREVIARAEGR